MADFSGRHPLSRPGKYFVDSDTCLFCELCREIAPKNIGWDDERYVAYVEKQASSPEEEAALKEASESCCVEAIGDDGDDYNWESEQPLPKQPWWRRLFS